MKLLIFFRNIPVWNNRRTGKNQKLLAGYQSEFKIYTQAKAKLLQLEKRLAEGNKEADYHQYLLQELEEAQLDQLNLDELKNELSAQENAETIIEQLSQTYQLLQQDEAGVLTVLNETKAKLSKITGYSRTMHNFQNVSRACILN